MCGRYVVGQTDKLKQEYDAYNNPLNLQPSFNIAPGSVNPVIAIKSPKSIYLMKWGLIPFWAKDSKIGYSMINARCEGIEAKPSYRKPIRSQRCLIPATGFYEWKKLKLEKKEEKIPWFIKVKSRDFFALAGIYDVWHDAEGKEVLSYSIITTTPNKFMSNIHDRMPVILNKKDEDKYLDNKTPLEDILKMLKPYPDSMIEGWPVSKEVNSPRNNYPSLIQKTS
jgi:putative SOS response-associated peptidase YedK